MCLYMPVHMSISYLWTSCSCAATESTVELRLSCLRLTEASRSHYTWKTYDPVWKFRFSIYRTAYRKHVTSGLKISFFVMQDGIPKTRHFRFESFIFFSKPFPAYSLFVLRPEIRHFWFKNRMFRPVVTSLPVWMSRFLSTRSAIPEDTALPVWKSHGSAGSEVVPESSQFFNLRWRIEGRALMQFTYTHENRDAQGVSIAWGFVSRCGHAVIGILAKTDSR